MRNVFLSSVLLFHIVNGTGGIRNHESSAYEAAALTTLLQFLIVDTTFHVLLLPMIMIRHWHIRIYHLECFPSAYGGRKSMGRSFSPISTLLSNIYKIYSLRCWESPQDWFHPIIQIAL